MLLITLKNIFCLFISKLSMIPFSKPFFYCWPLWNFFLCKNHNFTVSILIYNLNLFTEPHLHLLAWTETWHSAKHITALKPLQKTKIAFSRHPPQLPICWERFGSSAGILLASSCQFQVISSLSVCNSLPSAPFWVSCYSMKHPRHRLLATGSLFPDSQKASALFSRDSTLDKSLIFQASISSTGK